MSVPTPEQVIAANKYHSYTRGWLSGVAGKMRQETSRDAALNELYLEGYTAGQLARQAVSTAAQVRFGYKPSVLRTTDKA